MEVTECARQNVDSAANLFNQYRMFYELPDDLDKSRDFLHAKLEHSAQDLPGNEREEGSRGVRSALPSDLFARDEALSLAIRSVVDLSARGAGCARMLLDHLANIARAEGAHRISLDTAKTNLNAQKLYRSQCYEAGGEFRRCWTDSQMATVVGMSGIHFLQRKLSSRDMEFALALPDSQLGATIAGRDRPAAFKTVSWLLKT
ncbi:N-acetyltransferase [Pseudomonas sp. LS-2]|uniref:GNAT family N-acetyltransferase n=1 Tax=Pseudomonas sp. LS-2 TaxID=2315859 RepID=UPI002114D7F4|nr:GNAT family N-acetyltransferase [Pseudomonas sp. LS-2]